MAISLAHKSVTVDINNRNAPNIVTIANVNDKAVRYLDVTLTASGDKLTFTDCTVTATFATDGVLIDDAVVCTLNSTWDLITVPLENFKSLSGFLAIEIKIANGETQVLNTPLTLKVQVTPSLADSSKINKDTVGTTAEICREVAAARGDYDNLNARLNGIDTTVGNKADKATTLDGYGITDAYTKEKADRLLKNKLDSMPFDDTPKLNSPCYLTSGTVYNVLTAKYDAANIESGTSALTPYSTVTDKIKSASCTYKTIGDVVIVNATIKMNTVSMSGTSAYPLIDLPYKCMSSDNVFCVGISSNGKLFKFAVPKNNTWLQFMPQDKTAYTFTDGEQINVTCLYKIK